MVLRRKAPYLRGCQEQTKLTLKDFGAGNKAFQEDGGLVMSKYAVPKTCLSVTLVLILLSPTIVGAQCELRKLTARDGVDPLMRTRG